MSNILYDLIKGFRIFLSSSDGVKEGATGDDLWSTGNYKVLKVLAAFIKEGTATDNQSISILGNIIEVGNESHKFEKSDVDGRLYLKKYNTETEVWEDLVDFGSFRSPTIELTTQSSYLGLLIDSILLWMSRYSGLSECLCIGDVERPMLVYSDKTPVLSRFREYFEQPSAVPDTQTQASVYNAVTGNYEFKFIILATADAKVDELKFKIDGAGVDDFRSVITIGTFDETDENRIWESRPNIEFDNGENKVPIVPDGSGFTVIDLHESPIPTEPNNVLYNNILTKQPITWKGFSTPLIPANPPVPEIPAQFTPYLEAKYHWAFQSELGTSKYPREINNATTDTWDLQVKEQEKIFIKLTAAKTIKLHPDTKHFYVTDYEGTLNASRVLTINDSDDVLLATNQRKFTNREYWKDSSDAWRYYDNKTGLGGLV